MTANLLKKCWISFIYSTPFTKITSEKCRTTTTRYPVLKWVVVAWHRWEDTRLIATATVHGRHILQNNRCATESIATPPDNNIHDDVIKWKPFPRYWPFVRGIHRSPVNSPHQDQWRGALMLPLICIWTNAWVNNRDAGDLKRYRVHYDATVMQNQIDNIHQHWCK